MKQIHIFLMVFLAAAFALKHAEAAPYGPTLNEAAQHYAVTRNFGKLNDNLSKEQIPIRLDMSKDDVERWAVSSTVYHIMLRKNSIYKFDAKDYEPFDLSFDAWFAKRLVVVIDIYNINKFEVDDSELGLQQFIQRC